MDNILNLRLLAHPLNWLLVWLVLIFAGVGWSLFTADNSHNPGEM